MLPPNPSPRRRGTVPRAPMNYLGSMQSSSGKRRPALYDLLHASRAARARGARAWSRAAPARKRATDAARRPSLVVARGGRVLARSGVSPTSGSGHPGQLRGVRVVGRSGRAEVRRVAVEDLVVLRLAGLVLPADRDRHLARRGVHRRATDVGLGAEADD